MFRRLSSVWRSASTFFAVFGGFDTRGAFAFATSTHLLDCRRRYVDHPIELLRDLGFEVSFHLIHVGQLRERPAPERPEIVHAWYPVRVHRQLLVLRVLAAVALRLYD